MRLPSPSMVVAGVALVVALGGTGYAAIKLPKSSVGPAQLKSRAVTSAKIVPGAVGAKQLAGGAVGTAQLALGAVTSNRLAPGAVGGDNVADGGVAGSKLAPGSVTGSQVDEGTLARVPDAAALGGVPAGEFQRALSFVVRRKETKNSSNTPVQIAVLARCLEGERAVGGGAMWLGANIAHHTIVRSIPVRPVDADDASVQPAGEGEVATAWQAIGIKESIPGGTPGEATMSAYVICVK